MTENGDESKCGNHSAFRGYLHGMRVLRLCSVFAAPPAALRGRGVRFDPVGGMQSHTFQLSRALDRLGVRQTIVTTRPPGAPDREAFGERGRLIRLGLPIPVARQMYAVQAWPLLAPLARRADLLHAHLGEDLAIVPLALAGARCEPGHRRQGSIPGFRRP